MSETAIGIDIGGSAIKLGLVAADGCVVDRHRLPFDRRLSFDALADSLALAARQMSGGTGLRPRAIGIATPGYADRRDGRLVDGTANVPSLKGQSLTAALGARLRLPATIENDGVAATHGELRFGAGRGFRRFVLVALGTGVGGAVAIDGKVVTGSDGEPPEIGAMVLDAAGAANYSGLPGTFEHYCGVDGLLAAHRALDPERPAGTVEMLFARAAADDVAAAAAIDRTARRIAQALGAMINLLALEACLIGGGIGAAGPVLAETVARHLPDFTWPLLLSRATVRPAALGNDAGLVGAASLALDRVAGHVAD